jgi:hypothetical protein
MNPRAIAPTILSLPCAFTFLYHFLVALVVGLHFFDSIVWLSHAVIALVLCRYS